jgi:hypothetical protein
LISRQDVNDFIEITIPPESVDMKKKLPHVITLKTSNTVDAAVNTEPFEKGMVSLDFEEYFRDCKRNREQP